MKREQSRKHRVLQILRIATQAGFFGLFVYLFAVSHYTGNDYIGKTVERFFHFDPLIALATLIASRVLFASLALAGITIIVTIILGRVACGWVCPLGAVHQFFSHVFKKTKFLRPKRQEKASVAWKYYVLAFVLVAAVFSLDLAGVLDPLSFLYRSFAVGVFPGLTHLFSGLIKAVYGLHLDTLGRTLSQISENLMLNATFQQGLAMAVIFAGVVALNAWKERFWCRYICPLGALLGVFSRWNVFKLKVDDDKCIKCGLCTTHCETQAVPYPNDQWRSAECVYCETCAAICPTGAISFPAKARPERITNVDLSRRRLLLTTVLGAVAVPFFRLTPSRRRANTKLIRPPGALPEEAFLRKCVKCGECMKACPTNALQPALAEAGPEGIWTPMVVPKIGYCEYYCSLCSQVCPTGAIKELKIEEKTSVKIGSAWIKKDRCIPYAMGRPCIVCEEHCPTSPKAIKFAMVETKLPDGTTATEKAPVIDNSLCIGCGICENKCPVMDDPAIYVTSVGEVRSATNQLVLPLIGE
ncbi:MAG: 4Fe-4S binding protein [Candidatus Aminicenantales bacterium]